MAKGKKLPCLKLCIVGDKGVGKYSLGQQFAKGWIEPKETNASSTAQCPSKVVQLEERSFEVKVFICKEVDHDQFEDCDGIVVVFSVTDKASFTWATTTLETLSEKFNAKLMNGVEERNDDQQTDVNQKEMETESDRKIPVILVCNKVDEAKLSREVEEESGKTLSRKYHCAGFFETAAICNADVPKAFKCLLTEVAKNAIQTVDETDVVKPQKTCCVIL